MAEYTFAETHGDEKQDRTCIDEAATPASMPRSDHLPDLQAPDSQQAELLLRDLPGVLAVRVEPAAATADNAKARILLVTGPSPTATEMVEQARAAVSEHLGVQTVADAIEVIRVSHRALDAAGVKKMRLLGVCSGFREGRIKAQVEIDCRGIRFVGKAEQVGSVEGTTLAVAHATANALVQMLDGPSEVLVEEVQPIQIAGRTGVVVALSALQGGRVYQQLGCAWSEDDARLAVAQAIVGAAENLPLSWMFSEELLSKE